jgi:C-terminal processing protease CtpA/Prc
LQSYGHAVLLRRLFCTLTVVVLPACGGAAAPGSVGAVLVRDNDTRALHVRDAPSGRAAHEAGILSGDEIIMVDGRYVRDLTTDQIRSVLRGTVGSHVELTVVRGDEVHHVRVRREEMRHAEPKASRLETIHE